MIKSKNNYTNRLRKKIIKETKISNKKFITSYKDIKKYFKYFNNILFKDKLNNFKIHNQKYNLVYSSDVYDIYQIN